MTQRCTAALFLALFSLAVVLPELSAAPGRKTESAPELDPRMRDINRAWMDQIRGRTESKKSPGEGASEPGGRTNPGEGASDPGGRTNPGEGASEPGGRTGPGEGASNPGGRTSPGESASNPGGRTSPGESASNPGGRTSPGEGDPGKYQLNNPGNNPLKAPGDPAARPLFPEAAQGPSFVGMLLRFVAVMAVMLGGFYLVVRYLRSRTGNLVGGSDLIQVVASVPLVQGKFIQVVELAGKLVALGVSDAGVNLLFTVDDARTADRIRMWQSNRAAAPVVPAGFLEWFTKILKTAEFRFWNRSADKLDFQALLRRQGADGTHARADLDFLATTNPPAVDPLVADPLAADPLAADPRAVDPLAADPLAADPLAADPLAADPLAAEDPAQKHLRALLTAQRRRLSSLKNKNA